LVLGEQHHRRSPRRAETSQSLVIPERGLYTGTLVVGAIGTGKTSACLYRYVEQLLAYRAHDPAGKGAGLALEVKEPFWQQVREILARYGRGDDYVEVSLDSPYRRRSIRGTPSRCPPSTPIQRSRRSCVLQADVELPYHAIRHQVADAVQLVLHLGRRHGRRIVSELIRLEHYRPDEDRYDVDGLFADADYVVHKASRQDT
jgi:hypothetical protein